MMRSITRLFTPERPAMAARVEATGTLPPIELRPCGIHTSVAPCTLRSVIGAGIVACLCDPTTGIGGAVHFLLPRAGPDTRDPLRYGTSAMRMLVDRLVRSGARRHYLSAGLFGGARVRSTIREERWNYGMANSDLARAFLMAERISIHSEDVGGTRGRSLDFVTADGNARITVL